MITCLQFYGRRIVCGSDDKTLKVWSATTGKCLRTLVLRKYRTLKVWNAEIGQCVHTLYGHTSTFRCVYFHGKKVVSGSRDATLRACEIESGESLHVLVGHLAAQRCVKYGVRLVVSSVYDYIVQVWDPGREECLNDVVYRVWKLGRTAKPKMVHLNRLA